MVLHFFLHISNYAYLDARKKPESHIKYHPGFLPGLQIRVEVARIHPSRKKTGSGSNLRKKTESGSWAYLNKTPDPGSTIGKKLDSDTNQLLKNRINAPFTFLFRHISQYKCYSNTVLLL